MKGVLKEIIDNVESLEWDHDLYVAEGELSLDSPAAVIEDDGVSETFEGLQYFLSVQDIQSAVENLRTQISNPNSGQVLEAIKHYHAYDAFIQFQG
ncbi:hypothetical protein ACCI51_19175 [Microbulbifer echini]|uniref:DUF7716 domain-containing protein n=1 Tax=Microbulbifer echini TaxID=1529067 RepID=A0ABV4NSZ4_9GAMM